MKKFLFMLGCFLLLTLTPVYASEMQVDRGSGDDQSITDVIKDYPNTVTVDDASMHKADGLFSALGVLLSVLIYVIFAGLAFTTACDLAYIALPPARPFLYDGGSSSGQMNRGGVQISHGMAQSYVNNTQQNATQGGMNGKSSLGNRKLISSELINLLNTSVNNTVTSSILLKEYFKRRIVNIVLIIVVVIILLTSTVFTDFGLNIGQYILDIFNSLVGGA